MPSWEEWRGNQYKSEYCEIAFDILASGKTKSHVCRAIKCSKSALLQWMKENPEFNDAVQFGLSHGESVFLDKVETSAWQSASGVNNCLIKMLASNVYGIKEEPSTVVKVQQNNSNTPVDEQDLKDRGIPIPDMDLEDV